LEISSKLVIYELLIAFFEETIEETSIKTPSDILFNKSFQEIIRISSKQITQQIIIEFTNLLRKYWFTITTSSVIPCSEFEKHLPHFILELMKLFGKSVEGIEVEPLIRSGLQKNKKFPEIMLCSSVGSGIICKHGESCRFVHPDNKNIRIALVSDMRSEKSFTVARLCSVHESSKNSKLGTASVQCTNPECPFVHIPGKVPEGSRFVQRKVKKPSNSKLCPLVSSLERMTLQPSSFTNDSAVFCGNVSLQKGSALCYVGCDWISSLPPGSAVCTFCRDFNSSLPAEAESVVCCDWNSFFPAKRAFCCDLKFSLPAEARSAVCCDWNWNSSVPAEAKSAVCSDLKNSSVPAVSAVCRDRKRTYNSHEIVQSLDSKKSKIEMLS
jgi:hypothetical protein